MKHKTKVGVVLFHKNIYNVCQKKWIDKCLYSLDTNEHNIKNDYKTQYYEINYGGNNFQLKKNSKFWNLELENYAEAMNFIISKAFIDCTYVFNVNLDDFYHENRFHVQINEAKNGNDLISSNFFYVKEKNEQDVIFHDMNFTSKTDITYNFLIGNNVIAHPSVCYTRNFWDDEKNRYNKDLVPAEDFDLWKRALNNGYKFSICDEHLLYYRIHDKQSSNTKILKGKNDIIFRQESG
jgi:hypothetical protein